MSGIVGIFERSLAPVNGALLRALTSSLFYRGPDAQEVWSEGPVGFGHTMLRTTRESERENQPDSLDNRFWITADARIDCRRDLTEKLDNASRGVRGNLTDAQLILRAYAVWKENCVNHLRGDFSFAIWDQIEKRLFCARDHFGIKPFYYAEIGSTFVFSNTLNCVRLHPGVPNKLNDNAIFDFLLMGFNCGNTETSFECVRRLPPAHRMRISMDGIRVQRYWSLPTDGRTRYPREEDYIEHFESLIKESVADRMRTDRVGVFLSGGLDSSSIAATARQIGPPDLEARDLRAYTVGYRSLIPDDEPPLAGETAAFLGIPIRFLAFDNLRPFEGWDTSEIVWPEPMEDPLGARLFDQFALASECRVVLNGHGGDDIMSFQMWPYVKDLVRRGEWTQLRADGPAFLRLRRFPWLGLMRRVQKALGRGPLVPAVPTWLWPRWGSKEELRNRWANRTKIKDVPVHPVSPRAHLALSLPLWSFLFEINDPGVTRFPVEVRYPFFDVRLVEYVLSLPPFPWFFQKSLLRRAMARRLPQKILTRPKAPLTEDPLIAHAKLGSLFPIANPAWSSDMDRYVDRSKVLALGRGETSSEGIRVQVRPFCLNFWLLSLQAARDSSRSEAPMQTKAGGPVGWTTNPS